MMFITGTGQKNSTATYYPAIRSLVACVRERETQYREIQKYLRALKNQDCSDSELEDSSDNI